MISDETEKKITELEKIMNQNFKNTSKLEQQNFCNSISNQEDESLLMTDVLNKIIKNQECDKSKTIQQYVNEKIQKKISEKNPKWIEESTDEIRKNSEIRLLQDAANILEIKIIKEKFKQK